jgi:biuret amidohydrolase
MLSERAVDRINVMGLATQFSVEHTARDAADIGYSVRLISDCCASADMMAHEASLRTLSMLVEIVNSETVLLSIRRT